MPVKQLVTIDAEKVYALIEQLDLPVRSPRGRGSGKRAAFAGKIGRSRGAIWNLKFVPRISDDFAAQIAGALGVEVGDITAVAEDGKDDDEPEAVDAA